MDINKFLANAQSGGAGAALSSTSSEDEPSEKNARLGLYKITNMKMSGVSDGRALRAIQNEERRKSIRVDKFSNRRQIPEEDEHEVFDENDENNDQKESALEPKQAKKATSNDRRDKLKEFLAQKEKLAQKKRKNGKAAFRPSGKVQHKNDPAGAHKPNMFSVGANFNMSKNVSTLSRANSTLSRNTSTLSRTNATRGASSMLRSNSTLVRAKPLPALKETVTVAAKTTGARSKPAEGRETRTRRAKPVISPKKSARNPVKPPAIHVEPPAKSSSGSNSSNGSTSFAPQNFKFSISVAVTGSSSSSSESEASSSVVKISSTPKASALPQSSTPVQNLNSKKNIPLVSEIEKPTDKTAAISESMGSLVDDVFDEHKENETADDSSTIDMSEIDKEIASSAMKNRTAMKMEKSQTIPHFALNDGIRDSESSQDDEIEVAAILEPEKEKNPIEKKEESPRGRTTRRSRRMSGVQPDPSLTQDDLYKTPAKRAKERSRSSDRRSKVGQCLICPDHHSGEHNHDHSGNEPKINVMRTPMKTPRVSRKSTLPVLSETSPSQGEEENATNGSVAKRRTRNRSVNAASLAEVIDQKTDEDEEVVDREEERKKRRSRSRKSKSSVDVAENLLKPDENAMDIDLAKSEKKNPRRSLRATPALGIEQTPTPVRASRRRGKAIEDLAKNFENATLASAKKPVDKSATPEAKSTDNLEFKTPSLPMPRSVVKTSQSASKVQVSPLLNKSPWIDFGRRSSGQKRKSMSEHKRRKSDLSTMFDDIPDDADSPIHEILKNKAKSLEDLDIDVEAELQPNPAKQIRLDAEFDSIAEEQEKLDTNENPTSPTQVMHLGDIVCNAELHFDHFRKEYEKESKRIDGVCSVWEKKLENITEASEEVLGQLRSVIGQGRIMIARKGRFKQFATLVENCEFQLGEQKTTCTDLQGFWDMVYFQVEDVDKKFEDLAKLEATNWIDAVPEVIAPVVKKKLISRKPIKKPAPSSKTASSSLSAKPKMSKIQEMMAARRAALAVKNDAPEIRLNAPIEDVEKSDEEKTFDAGFFAIKSPVRTPKSADGSPQRAEKSKSRERNVSGGDKLRRAVLTESARRLSGFSPMVSAMAKRSMSREAVGESSSGPTSPVKDSRRSALFDDLEEDDAKDEEAVEETVTKSPAMIDPIAPLSSPVTKTYGRQVGSPAMKQRQVDAFDAMVMSGGKADKNESGGEEVILDDKYFVPGTPTESLPGNTPTGPKWSTSSEEVTKSNSKKTETSPNLRKNNPRVSLLPGMDTLSPPVVQAGEVDMMNFDDSPPPPVIQPNTPRRSRRSQI